MLDNDQDIFNGNAISFMKEYSSIDVFDLSPLLVNRFKRITLINPEKTERVTIDFLISLSKHGNGKKILTPYIAVFEIKQKKTVLPP